MSPVTTSVKFCSAISVTFLLLPGAPIDGAPQIPSVVARAAWRRVHEDNRTRSARTVPFALHVTAAGVLKAPATTLAVFDRFLDFLLRMPVHVDNLLQTVAVCQHLV